MDTLTKVPHYHCVTSEHFETTVCGSSGDAYTVMISSRGNFCTCPAFKYGRGRDCKHIKKALKESYCGWMQAVHGGFPDRTDSDEPICPDCGAPVAVMLWGV